ncbi:MAG: aminotransferase class IV [bacterium]|nr:aminotransferase class IV [bacterium]
MGLVVYIDGEFIPEVNCSTIGEQYGLFESLIFEDGKIFKLKEHLDRLYDGAKFLNLRIPLEKNELSEAIYKTVAKNGLSPAYVRVGIISSEIFQATHQSISLQIIVKPLPQYPEEIYTSGVSGITVPTRRHHFESTNPLIKSSDFEANILAKIEGSAYFEAIMLNETGYVTEGTISNIFIYKNGILITPPAYLGLLNGITRGLVIELAKHKQIEVKEEVISRYELYCCEEAFLTFTSAQIVPVTKIDGRTIGSGQPGAITQKLLSLLFRHQTL